MEGRNGKQATNTDYDLGSDSNAPRMLTPLPLPPMDDPVVYIIHQDVMPIIARRNYIRDRMRAAITYINGYHDTQAVLDEDKTHRNTLLTRLQIVFGRVNSVREKIDEALLIDDMHRRRRNMRSIPYACKVYLPVAYT